MLLKPIPPNTDVHLLRTRQLAQYLDCSETTILRMVRQNMFPVYRVRRSFRYNLQEVLDALLRSDEDRPLTKQSGMDIIRIHDAEKEKDSN